MGDVAVLHGSNGTWNPILCPAVVKGKLFGPMWDDNQRS